MKLNDHLDFHKLPFDKEKIREQVEKIAADCMHWVTGRQNARPLLAMVLCTRSEEHTSELQSLA